MAFVDVIQDGERNWSLNLTSLGSKERKHVSLQVILNDCELANYSVSHRLAWFSSLHTFSGSYSIEASHTEDVQY